MRVTIGHREESGGISGQRRTYFVDCTIEFSEEERAIIKARDLYRHNIVVLAATPLPSRTAVVGIGFMRTVGVLCTIAGPAIGIVGGFTKSGGEGLGFALLFGGLAMMIFGKRRANQQDHRLVQPEQSVTVSQLLSKPRFVVHALDPAHAKFVDSDIRARLLELKKIIRGSAELQTAQTFEL